MLDTVAMEGRWVARLHEIEAGKETDCLEPVAHPHHISSITYLIYMCAYTHDYIPLPVTYLIYTCIYDHTLVQVKLVNPTEKVHV